MSQAWLKTTNHNFAGSLVEILRGLLKTNFVEVFWKSTAVRMVNILEDVTVHAVLVPFEQLCAMILEVCAMICQMLKEGMLEESWTQPLNVMGQ